MGTITWSTKWKPNIVYVSDGLGFIEDVYGTGTSFNVFRLLSDGERVKFYRSAYKLDRAKELLNNLIK